MKLRFSSLVAGLCLVAASALNLRPIVNGSFREPASFSSDGLHAGIAARSQQSPERSHAKIARQAGEVIKDQLGNVTDVIPSGLPFHDGEEADSVDRSNAGCGALMKVDATNNPESCPALCPLFAEAPSSTGSFCEFQCVPASTRACGAANPSHPVVSLEMGMCTACRLTGCSKCTADGHLRCAECQAGYTLANGSCYSNYWIIWILLFSVVGLLLLVIIAWIIDLSQRRVVNQIKLDKALLLRSHSKLHTHYEDEQTQAAAAAATLSMAPAQSVVPHLVLEDDVSSSTKRKLHPITTNLLRKAVAGPGLVLSFNFQFIVICWACGVGIAWIIYAIAVDRDLLVLGTKVAETVKDYCHVVSWGYQTQQRLMWAKANFVLWLYLLTFLGCLAHGVRQLRMFQSMDIDRTTHKDFCARCIFKITMPGTLDVEDVLTDVLQKALQMPVVGVSVCWNYTDEEQKVMKYLSELLMHREGTYPKDEEPSPRPKAGESDSEQPQTRCGRWLWTFHKWTRPVFAKIEQFYLAPETQRIMTKERMSRGYALHQAVTTPRYDRENQIAELTTIVNSLKTTGEAWAVFKTERDRDLAVETAKGKQSELVDLLVERLQEEGIEVEAGNRDVFRLEEAVLEPDGLIWANCISPTWIEVFKRVSYGVCVIGMALLAWVCLFYFPYALYITSYDYSYGTVPDFVPMMVFTIIVVCGNALMYFVCSIVAERVGFRYQDHREVCYMLLYCFACLFNVLLDLFTTYAMVYSWMVGKGVRTYDGKPLAEISTFTQAFETYAMQRALGDQLFLYAFPGTFLYPFLFEPLLTIVVPYILMSWIVRSSRFITLQQAERYLSAQRMDLSRYADLHVNIILATISFYFPGGFIPWMFFALAFSHTYIYLYDHCRVLRSIPHCEFSRMQVDWWAQWLMSIGCAILLSSCIFKFNCEEGKRCSTGWVLIVECTAVAVGHVILHSLLLVYVVPLFGIRNRAPSRQRYSTCSRKIACNWFNANPIHCLRSQLHYKHSTPCHFFFPGKEHMLLPNPELGLYFMDNEPEAEAWGSPTGTAHETFSSLYQYMTEGVNEALSRSGTRHSSLRSPMSAADLRVPSSEQSPANMYDVEDTQAPVPGG